MTVLRLDPLHGIDPAAVLRDGAAWEEVLRSAWRIAGPQDGPGCLFGLLRGLRACGAALVPAPAGLRLDPPPDMTREELRAEIGGHAQTLAAILRAGGDVRLIGRAAGS